MSAKDVSAFENIEIKRRGSPDKSTRELLASSGINPAAYYRGRKAKLAGSEKKAPRPKPQPKPAPKAASTRRKEEVPSLSMFKALPMFLLIGSPEQMKAALTGAL